MDRIVVTDDEFDVFDSISVSGCRQHENGAAVEQHEDEPDSIDGDRLRENTADVLLETGGRTKRSVKTSNAFLVGDRVYHKWNDMQWYAATVIRATNVHKKTKICFHVNNRVVVAELLVPSNAMRLVNGFLVDGEPLEGEARAHVAQTFKPVQCHNGHPSTINDDDDPGKALRVMGRRYRRTTRRRRCGETRGLVIGIWSGNQWHCEHGKVRSVCKACGGGSICDHGRQRHQCKPCGCKGEKRRELDDGDQ